MIFENKYWKAFSKITEKNKIAENTTKKFKNEQKLKIEKR